MLRFVAVAKDHLSMDGPTVLVPDTAEEVDAVPVVAGQVLHVRERVQALLVGGRGTAILPCVGLTKVH
jgi:hypothetical protein